MERVWIDGWVDREMACGYVKFTRRYKVLPSPVLLLQVLCLHLFLISFRTALFALNILTLYYLLLLLLLLPPPPEARGPANTMSRDAAGT